MYNTFSFQNASGVACPLSSISYEKDFGIGDLRGAYKFIDFLSECGFSAWKMLPIQELVEENDFSPYNPVSAFAIDSLYIDILSLQDINYTDLTELIYLNRLKFHQQAKTHFLEIRKFKNEVLRIAFEEFFNNEFLYNTNRFKDFQDFINVNHEWILDYGLYRAISDELQNIPFQKWPVKIKQKDKNTITLYRKKLEKDIFFYQYVQWITLIQWQKFKNYANKKGVSLIGDVSFYVGAMSVDVWSNPQYFNVDENLNPTTYGGCPADSLNINGQVWHVAIYNWDRLKENNYIWWLSRLDFLANLFDCLRLDHFRGYIQYWEIRNPKLPLEGEWKQGPGYPFINLIAKHILDKRLCGLYVENLGYITDEVESIRNKVGLSGSFLYVLHHKILHQNNFSTLNMVESTSHDLSPLKKWWREITKEEKSFIIGSLGLALVENDFYEMSDTIRLKILEFLSIQTNLPLILYSIQDLLGLEEIINIPGTSENNWTFRIPKNVEGLLVNNPLVIQIQNITKKSASNKSTPIAKAKTIPLINGSVTRTYKIYEPMVFWCFTKNKSDVVQAVHNISVNKEIIEVSMKAVYTNIYGTLFFYSCTTAIPSSYFFTIKINDIYISEFEKDLYIVVED